MNDTIDLFVKEIKEQIIEELKEAYSEKIYKRMLNPLYRGVMDSPDAFARSTGGCGDTMEIYLRFENNRVKEALYQTDGCESSNLCGSLASEMAIGKDPDELLAITGDAIFKEAEGLPDDDYHCATLASVTLQEALNNYMIKQRKYRQM
ncbi:MAG: iron-sulfur cluster assembly scaffold protein [Deltaproteobacteria bacterium]|nr:iron-sulfur cluster assembly scaffold protein [Deltaproteobacteria bacterium]